MKIISIITLLFLCGCASTGSFSQDVWCGEKMTIKEIKVKEQTMRRSYDPLGGCRWVPRAD